VLLALCTLVAISLWFALSREEVFSLSRVTDFPPGAPHYRVLRPDLASTSWTWIGSFSPGTRRRRCNIRTHAASNGWLWIIVLKIYAAGPSGAPTAPWLICALRDTPGALICILWRSRRRGRCCCTLPQGPRGAAAGGGTPGI